MRNVNENPTYNAPSNNLSIHAYLRCLEILKSTQTANVKMSIRMNGISMLVGTRHASLFGALVGKYGVCPSTHDFGIIFNVIQAKLEVSIDDIVFI